MTSPVRLILVLSLSALSVKAELRSPAKWLVDLGRDYPLSAQAGLSDADAQLSLAFMEAATRIDPELAEGYYWQFDLLHALGRDKEALTALNNYILYAPNDVPAALEWANLTIDSLQTAEKRIAFCQAQLKNKSLPPPAISLLHLHLAQIFNSRGEQKPAKQHAKYALEKNPRNRSAQIFIHQLQDKPTSPVFHMQNLLAGLSDNPAGLQQAWELANLLASYNLPIEANRFYQHAIQMFILTRQNPPLELLIARASALTDSKKWPEAQELLKQILEQEPRRIDAHLAAARLAELQNDPSRTAEHLQQAADSWKKLLVDQTTLLQNHPALVAEAA
jgi:tetratricopeptide (TPR) repeat protein